MKIGFYKDEDEGSKTKGMYWLVVNGHLLPPWVGFPTTIQAKIVTYYLDQF